MSERNSKLLNILKRMVFYSQISAAYPFHEPFKSTIRYKLCLFYQFAIFFFHNVILFQHVLALKLNSKSSNENIMEFLGVVADIAMTMAADINVTMILWRRRILSQIFGRLEAVDVRLELLGCSPRYSTTSSFAFLAACPFIFPIAIQLHEFSWFPLYLTAVSSSALAVVRLSTGVLDILAKQLRCLRTEVYSSKNTFGIVFFSDLHGSTAATCQLAGRVFANQMLIILASTFLFVVINTRYFLQCVYLSKFIAMPIFIRTCWTYGYIFLGYRVVDACVTIRHEVF